MHVVDAIIREMECERFVPELSSVMREDHTAPAQQLLGLARPFCWATAKKQK